MTTSSASQPSKSSEVDSVADTLLEKCALDYVPDEGANGVKHELPVWVKPGSGADPNLKLEDILNGEELEKAKDLHTRVPNARVSQIVRFLRARDGNVQVAEEFLKAHLEWRKKIFPLPMDLVKKEVKKNKYVLYCKDREGRHVVIIRNKIMGKHTYDDILEVNVAMAYLQEYLETIISPTEKISVIFSRHEATIKKNSDLNWVKEVGTMLNNNYPERLHKAHVAPIGILFRSAWKVAQYFFDPETRSKINFHSDISHFQQIVHVSDLPEELGGTSKKELTADEVFKHDIPMNE